MQIRGIVFAGTATPRRDAMSSFVEGVLGLARAAHGGGNGDNADNADMFELPDGTRFAVADEREEHHGTSRTIGFLVDDVRAARQVLLAAGTEVDEPQQNERHRYVHFVAPDGELYELVEELRPAAGRTR
jgi:catechol 2,3-dioxygenase-like lactoylglutathione lyase family enzyme